MAWSTDGRTTEPPAAATGGDRPRPSVLGGSSRGPVQKAALIDVRPARRVGDRVLVEIAWRSASFAPLFLVFAGQLSISATEIVLDGRYAPPLGTLGLLLDQALLHLAARRTAGALLTRVATAF